MRHYFKKLNTLLTDVNILFADQELLDKCLCDKKTAGTDSVYRLLRSLMVSQNKSNS